MSGTGGGLLRARFRRTRQALGRLELAAAPHRDLRRRHGEPRDRDRGKGIAGSRRPGRSLFGNAIVARAAGFGAGALLSLGGSARRPDFRPASSRTVWHRAGVKPAGSPGRVVHVAVEPTGWLFVSRALERCGAILHLAQPVETSALRGRKRRAKTDRADAKWLRQLLWEGRLSESWLPPEHVRQWRSRARLRNTLIAERTSWTHDRFRLSTAAEGTAAMAKPSTVGCCS
jgi:hypothetical protein